MNLSNVIWNVPYFRVRFVRRIPEEEYAKVLLLIVCTMIFRQHKRKQVYSRNKSVLEFIQFILIPKYCQSERIMSQRQPNNFHLIHNLFKFIGFGFI